MGDVNQLNFARKYLSHFRPPVLEIGSRDYGNTVDLRSLLQTPDYVGIDLEPGPGVDLVLDATDSFALIDERLQGRRFQTIFCLSVLEHCTDPFGMCDNIQRLMAGGGAAFISVPHVWEQHDYPGDYWRFTAAGVKLLFPQLEFPDELSEISRGDGVDSLASAEQPSLVWHTVSHHLRRHSPLGAARAALAKCLLRSRMVFAPCMLNMIGLKRDGRQ